MYQPHSSVAESVLLSPLSWCWWCPFLLDPLPAAPLTLGILLDRAPELAPLKSKMIYASSKDAIKKKFQGTRRAWA